MKKQTEFKLNKRDSLWFQDNSAAVNIAYAKEVCDLAILPIGAIEQHGPHCPCGLPVGHGGRRVNFTNSH